MDVFKSNRGQDYFKILPVTVLSFLAGSLFLLTLSYIQTALRSGLRSLPGPFAARFTGLYRLKLVYKGDAPYQYRQVHEKYGPIVRVGPNHVSVSDEAMIPVMYGIGSKFLKTDFYDLSCPFYKGEPMHTTFSTRDPVYHRAFRSQVAALYSMSNIRKFEGYADECSVIFANTMKELEGEVIDLAPWLQWYAFDVIGNITFRRRFGFMEERRDVDEMMAGLDAHQWYAQFIGQFPHLHPYLFGNRTLMAFLKTIMPNMPDPLGRFMGITDEEIQRYASKQQGTDRTDFLAQLRDKEAKEGKLSHRDIVSHVSNNLLAGSDTTAISLRACFYYLVKGPHTYKKLQKELDDAAARGELSEYPTYEETLRLPYLHAVMKEAMRLHPGVGFPLERFVPEGGALICGYHVPAGVNISTSAPLIHHNKEIFGPDTHVFRPERWLEASEEKLKVMDRNSLAFGYGTRTCTGKNISLMEMGKFIPMLLSKFDIEWAGPNEEWTTRCAWFWKQKDIFVRFKSRDVKTG